MDSYMSEHQDRSRNALQKAAEASFLAWCEELKADQAQFLSEKILCLGCAIYNTYYSNFYIQQFLKEVMPRSPKISAFFKEWMHLHDVILRVKSTIIVHHCS